MLANWEAEKNSLVKNYQHLKAKELRKRLRTAWRTTNRSEGELSRIDNMRKTEVVKHLYDYFEINTIIERQNRILLEN